MVRNYLAPAYNCAKGPTSCTQPTPVQQPYIVLRDASTGCLYQMYDANGDPTAYYSALVNTASNPCAAGEAGCQAVVSATNPSGGSSPGVFYTSWLDGTQLQQHVNYENLTPQHCYADGQSVNQVAWTRLTDWESLPSPDDSYVGGAVSYANLTSLSSGNELMQFDFQLPSAQHAMPRALFVQSDQQSLAPVKVPEPDILVSGKRAIQPRGILHRGPGRAAGGVPAELLADYREPCRSGLCDEVRFRIMLREPHRQHGRRSPLTAPTDHQSPAHPVPAIQRVGLRCHEGRHSGHGWKPVFGVDDFGRLHGAGPDPV